MRKVIFDTDPGIDDAYAIIYAMKHPDVEVLGLCTVAGNKGIEMTTNNALKLVQLMESETKVYQGASKSLYEVRKDAGGIHGSDGLGGVPLPYDHSQLSDKSAVDFILEMVKTYPNEVEIIAIGPVTNIALAIQQDYETMKNVKSIYTMGGGIDKGNVTPYAEFNYWYDVTAVEIMLSLGEYVPIHMIGLNLTHQSVYTNKDIEFLKNNGGQLGEYLSKIVTPYLDYYYQNHRYDGCVLHDLLCAVYAINPSVCSNIQHIHVDIISQGEHHGQTIISLQDSVPNIYLPMTVNHEAYMSEFIEVVFGESVKRKYLTK